MQVVEALYNRAVGMDITKTRILKSEGTYVAVRYTEKILPDVKACEYWLNNRQRQNWKAKRQPSEPAQGLFSINIHTELHPEIGNKKISVLDGKV